MPAKPAKPNSSSHQKNIVHVEAISPLPKTDKQERKGRSKVSHAAELTGSLCKCALEASKAQASTSGPKKRARPT